MNEFDMSVSVEGSTATLAVIVVLLCCCVQVLSTGVQPVDQCVSVGRCVCVHAALYHRMMQRACSAVLSSLVVWLTWSADSLSCTASRLAVHVALLCLYGSRSCRVFVMSSLFASTQSWLWLYVLYVVCRTVPVVVEFLSSSCQL